MPCRSEPDSPEEQEAQRKRETDKENLQLLEVEKQNCFRKYGERDTELNIATRVACELSKGIKSDLVKRWVNHHNVLDKQRRFRETKEKIESQLLEEAEHWRAHRRAELEAEYGLNEGKQ